MGSLLWHSRDQDVSSLRAMMTITAWVGTCLVRISVTRLVMRGYWGSGDDDDDYGVGGNDNGVGGGDDDDIDIVVSVS